MRPTDALLPHAAQPQIAMETGEPVSIGALERLPKWLILIPMTLQWIWLSIRYGSLTLPAAANPAVTAGGLVGEGKSEYFNIMGPLARSFTADYAIVGSAPCGGLPKCEAAMQRCGLEYPLIAKPDIGWCGFGVRLVANAEDLQCYLKEFPNGEDIVLQRYIPYEGEAGLYYVRNPGAHKGRVIAILLRSFPCVVGNGQQTIGELISMHPRARRVGQDGRSQPCCDPTMVPRLGEIVRVSIAGSSRVGGLYSDASALVTPALESALDMIAQDMRDIHVARFDVRYETLSALQDGKGFKIIEVNGAGSEAVQAWDPKYSLHDAFRIIFEKQRVLFRIGSLMRKRGHVPVGLLTLARLFFRQARLIAHYPKSN